jgi:hypothetical protein
MNTPVDHARDFLKNPINSYNRLAEHLNVTSPRIDGIRWTKDSAYHLCRSNGISSLRPCRSQPAASFTLRTRSCQSILSALLSNIASLGLSLVSLAPFQIGDIARLSEHSFATVSSNWYRLEPVLLDLAKLPRKATLLTALS